jgi:O-antigen/teichoic acid export membrane protein
MVLMSSTTETESPSLPPESPALVTDPAPSEIRAATDTAFLSGFAWTAASKWTVQILSWASTLLVARILMPQDFGILGMALVYLGLVSLINELGLGAAVIQKRGLTERQLSQLTTVSFALGFAFAGLSVAAAQPVAGFFSEPALEAVIAVLSITLVMSGLQVVPRSLLTRDLRFRTLALIDAAQAVTAATLTLILALSGLGYWSLVLGNVIAKALTTLIVLFVRFQPFGWPFPLRDVLPALRFGGHTTLANVGWYVYGQADAIVIGRILGTAPLGSYQIGATIASAPAAQVNSLLSRVVSGIFSTIQDDRPEVHRYLRAILRTQALVLFPATIGMALVAPDFVYAVLGEHWEAAILPLQILAVTAAIRCVMPMLSQALLFTGFPEQNTKITLVGAIVLPVSFLVGVRWGIAGVALGWLVGYSISILPMSLFAVRKCLDFGFRSFAKAMVPGVVSTAPMILVVLGVGVAFANMEISPGYSLVAKVTSGGLAYGLAVRILYWDLITSVYDHVQRARLRQRTPLNERE